MKISQKLDFSWPKNGAQTPISATVYDTKEICKILVEQYNSQYSRNRNTEKISNDEINDTKKEISRTLISAKMT